MPRLPQLSAREVSRVLKRLGFVLKRQRGSHMVFEHPDGRLSIIPCHPGEDLDRGLLHKIVVKELGLTVEQFLDLL